jgi:DNA-entry nuclease
MKKLLMMALCLMLLSGCGSTANNNVADVKITDEIVTEYKNDTEIIAKDNVTYDWTYVSSDNIPVYQGVPYVVINSNEPFFNNEDRIRTDAFEYYSELDEFGRCGVAYANICEELQPTEERGSIGHIKPSGWHTVKYNGYIEGNYLYNRCHLIGYQLAGENANELNLITGTRYMNCDGQLPFEDMVDDYVDDTGNHVLYRVTPIYDGDNLVASGVLTEAYSVEDNGEGLSFCVYCFNVQPGIGINYATGESWFIDGYKGEYSTETYFSTKQIKNYVDGNTFDVHSDEHTDAIPDANNGTSEEPHDEGGHYVLNTNTMKFHKTDCRYASDISENNKDELNVSREALLQQGYYPCKVCNP